MDAKVALGADLSALLAGVRGAAVSAANAVPPIPKNLVTVTPDFAALGTGTVPVTIEATPELKAWVSNITARLNAFASAPA